MTRTGHHLLGAAVGLAVAQALGWPLAAEAGATALACMVAPLPDIDNRGWYKRAVAKIPFRSWRRVLGHRRLLHWWGLPAAPLPAMFVIPQPLAWALLAMVAGWGSHLLGDWVFGKRGPRETGWRPPGIPLAPCSRYVGLGLKVGGRVERWVAWPLTVVILIGQAALIITSIRHGHVW